MQLICYIRVCSEILFSERLCRVEASCLIFDANWLTGFYMEGSFTGKCYRTTHNLFLLTFFFFQGSYVTSFYSKHICIRCYYLYSLTLLVFISL